MSESAIESGGEVEPSLPAETGNGIDPTAIAEVASPETSSPVPTTPSDEDGLTEPERRAMSGGDEALKQFQHWQRVANDKDLKIQSFGDPLTNLVNSDGAERVTGFIQEYQTVLANPQLKQVLTQYLADGSLPGQFAQREEPEDDLRTPEEKEIAELRQELGSLKNQVGRTELSQTRAQAQDAFASVLKDWPMTPEIQQKIDRHLATQQAEWDKNPQGAQIYSNLNQATAQALMFQALAPEDIEILGARRRALREEPRKAVATDAPSAVGTTGSGQVQLKGLSAHEAFKAACKADGRDPERLFGHH